MSLSTYPDLTPSGSPCIREIRVLLRSLILALVALLWLAVTCNAADKPNIVLIFADDLGINDLHCYGREEHRTPNLDRLAEQGMKFTTAYCAQAICSPSRAAMLTGKSPARLHLTTFLPGRPDANSQKLLHPKINQQLPLEEVTLPELLKPAGYVSACVGKWHLGGKGFGPEDQGFDFVFAGKANTQPSAQEGGKGEYGLTAKAIEFIEKNRDKPFFLYLPHNTPHVPLGAKPELTAKNKDAYNPTYAAMIESLDDTVGLLLAKLDELKLTENTLVVFTSDNGGLHVLELPNTPATHNQPFRAGKGFVYEGGLREPLIARWPGKIKPGSVVDAPVSIADLMPTFLEAAGVEIPAGLDFQSLLPVLKGEPLKPGRKFYWHFPHYTNQGGKPAGALRDGDWKLVERYEDGGLELYNLAKDSGESTDLASSEPGKVAAFRTALETWRREVGAQENSPNPDFDPAAYARCYVQTDVTTSKPGKSAAEDAGKLAPWRAAMDAAVKNPSAEARQARGFIQLKARDAKVTGEKLRYEDAPAKDTLGFWVKVEDTASWNFEVKYPGRYRLELLQGAGKGSGGAVVSIEAAGQQLEYTVAETGHFQAFVAREAGIVDLPAGAQTLTVRPKSKKGAAVMDLRRISLTRVAD